MFAIMKSAWLIAPYIAISTCSLIHVAVSAVHTELELIGVVLLLHTLGPRKSTN